MQVYLDHAATTPLDEEVFEKMKPYFTEKFGNSHSQHTYGKVTANAVDAARAQVAAALGAKPNEIYFTGSGTESDNWALKGTASAMRKRGTHIITSAIEHHAVLNSAHWLEKNGFTVTYLPVDSYGIVKLDELEKALTPGTTLVSVMLANNEVGTIEPIKEIVEICRKNRTLVHCDCVQAVGAVNIDVKELGVDLASVSAHKFYGPKGIGALYMRNGLRIDSLIVGGGQERGLRGGTSDTPAIVGMGEAITKAVREMDQNNAHIKKLRDYFVERVKAEIPFVRYNGHPTQRLPSNANFTFEYIEGESILMLLDLGGVAVSSGSACSSGTLDPSHVLMALGVPVEVSHGSIRFSFGKHNTLGQVDYTVELLKKSVEKLRAMSPLFKLNEGELKSV